MMTNLIVTLNQTQNMCPEVGRGGLALKLARGNSGPGRRGGRGSSQTWNGRNGIRYRVGLGEIGWLDVQRCWAFPAPPDISDGCQDPAQLRIRLLQHAVSWRRGRGVVQLDTDMLQ